MSTPSLQRNVGGGGFTPVAQVNPPALPTTITQTSNKAAIITTASTNAALLSSVPGRLGYVILGNTAATWAYLKLYDKATAPVPGTDTPVAVYAIPPAASGGQLIVLPLDGAPAFANGIGIAITLAAALADATALAGASTVVGTITF